MLPHGDSYFHHNGNAAKEVIMTDQEPSNASAGCVILIIMIFGFGVFFALCILYKD
jgi:hypothetical protein